MTGRSGVQERLAHAHHSSDLKHHEHTCDVDTLGAMGMVSCSRPIAVHLLRLKYDNDAKAYKPALERLIVITRGTGKRLRWKASEIEIERLARVTLNYWINPKCRKCTGLGFPKMPDAPTLQAKPCRACTGSGMARPMLPKSMPFAVWEPRVFEVLEWLAKQEHYAAGELMGKLSNRIDDALRK